MKPIKKTTEQQVKKILQTVPQTRNSDMLLYYHVCLEIDKSVLKLPFWMVLLDMKGYGLPPIASVGRARRKLQRAFPELKACKTVQEARAENEVEYRNYARSECK